MERGLNRLPSSMGRPTLPETVGGVHYVLIDFLRRWVGRPGKTARDRASGLNRLPSSMGRPTRLRCRLPTSSVLIDFLRRWVGRQIALALEDWKQRLNRLPSSMGRPTDPCSGMRIKWS